MEEKPGDPHHPLLARLLNLAGATENDNEALVALRKAASHCKRHGLLLGDLASVVTTDMFIELVSLPQEKWLQEIADLKLVADDLRTSIADLRAENALKTKRIAAFEAEGSKTPSYSELMSRIVELEAKHTSIEGEDVPPKPSAIDGNFHPRDDEPEASPAFRSDPSGHVVEEWRDGLATIHLTQGRATPRPRGPNRTIKSAAKKVAEDVVRGSVSPTRKGSAHACKAGKPASARWSKPERSYLSYLRWSGASLRAIAAQLSDWFGRIITISCVKAQLMAMATRASCQHPYV